MYTQYKFDQFISIQLVLNLLIDDPLTLIVSDAQVLIDIALKSSQRNREEIDIDKRVTENDKTFWHNSLALVTYPWASGVVMQPDLSNVFDQDHFAFVSLAINPICIQIH